MDKNKQIKDLIAKGFTRNQAAMICLSNEHKMQEGGDTIRIDDSRRVKYASNTPVDPNTDLVSGDYRSNIIQDIVNAALKNGVDPNTAIALAMQESKIGNTDENLGHIVGGSYRGNEANDMTKAMSDKMHEGRKLGRKSDEELLQMYNGTGKVFPTTEQDYHGYKMKKIYGVPIPKQGIDMGKENLYGKQIVDIRDNVIKKNKIVQDTVKKLKNNFNFFEGVPYKNTIPTGEEIFQSGAYNNVNPKLFQQGGFTGARLDRPDTSNYINEDIILPQVQGANSSRYEDSLYGAMLTPYGEQLRQQGVEANSDQTDEQKSFSNKMNFQNNYDSLSNLFQDNIPQDNVGLGLYTFGQGLGDKDPWKISTGAGLALVSGLRQGVSGFGTGRQNEMARKEMQRKQFEDMRKPTMYKEGGHITNAAVMTGRFITDEAQGNVELEKGEIVKDNTNGDIKKVEGDWHKDGGVKTTLDDAKVHSNYTEIGAKNAKELSDKYKLSLKKTDTFAKGMDKFNAKLGVNKLVEEQTKLIERLGDNQTIKSEATKKVNEESLNSKIKGIEDRLNTLKGVQNYVFEDIFARQEEIPKQGDGKTLLDDKGDPMMQEGGHIYSLASKYGISPERAMQLMQEGGQMQSPQEEQMEGQASNPQEEQGEVSPEQIVADALSKGAAPEEILQYLVQSGFPEDQAKSLIQEVAQQLQQTQNPQEEQMEGAPQEEQVEQPQEMMKKGGEYDSNHPYGKNWTKADKKLRYEAALQQARLLGYDGNLTKNDFEKDSAWGELQKYVTERRPETVKKYAKNTRLTAKHVEDIKKIDPNIFKVTGVSINKPNENYSEEETQLLSEAAKKSTKLPETFWTNGFNDSLGAFRYPMVSTNLQPQGMTQGALAQISAPNMNKFASTEAAQPQNEVSSEESKTSTQGVNQNTQAMTLPTINSDFILPPSAMQAINKPYIPLGRTQAVNASSSANTQEIARQNQTALESLRASGLPPQVVEAIAAGQLATSQGSANEAIGKVNQYNAQSQNQADLFNIGQASKEDLMNTQYAQDYQDKMMATINAYEGNLNRYFIQNNLQNRQNRLDKLALNTMNRENFSINGNGNISYIAPQQIQGEYQEEDSNKKWEDMSAEEQIAERDRRLKNMQLAKNYKKTIT